MSATPMTLFQTSPADSAGVAWRVGEAWEANYLLAAHHYLGPLSGATLTIVGEDGTGAIVAAMMWRYPTARFLPADGTWLELSRWCLTPAAGANAGSRMHRAAVRVIRDRLPLATTLVSYSDPFHGHTGALYRACNWVWSPTWGRLRPPPTRGGAWAPGKPQGEPKDRWVFCLRPDPVRAEVLRIGDAGAVRFWRRSAPISELKWASSSLVRAELLEATT